MKTQVLRAVMMIILTATTWVSFSQTYSNPESVTFDENSNCYFISNPGNRSIIRLNENGQLSNFVHFGVLTNPKGLVISNNILYVVNNNKIYGFSLTDATLNSTFTIAEATTLKDIDKDESGNLYVSDPEAGIIYKLNVVNQNYTSILSSGINTPSGLLYDGTKNRLLICSGNGNQIIELQLNTRSINNLVTTSFEGLAGLAMDNCGNVYVSSLDDNAVYAFDSEFHNPHTKIMDNLNGPADLLINPNNQKLVVPNSGANEVIFKDMGLSCFNVTMVSPANNSVITGNNVVFQWQNLIPKDLVGYEIEYSTDVTFTTNTVTIQTQDYSTNPVFLNDGIYYWRVRTLSGAAKELFGQVWKFTVQGTSDNPFDKWELESLKPYPNPVKDAIYLPKDLFSYIIYIYDENGNLIREIDTRYTDDPGKINFSDLSNGIYFLRGENPRGDMIVHRIVVCK